MFHKAQKRVKVSLTGGLGNQFFQVTAALALTDKQIEIEWSLGSPNLNNDGFPEIENFNLPPRVTFARRRKFRTIFKRVLNLLIRLSRSAERNKDHVFSKTITYIANVAISISQLEIRKVVTPNGIGYSDIQKTDHRSFLVGYFQSYKWADSVRNEILSISLKKKSEELQYLIEEMKNKNVLAIHVRLGDYLGIETFGIPEKKFYLESIERAQAEGIYDEIWIFSNDTIQANEYLKGLSGLPIKMIGTVGNSSAEVLELMRNAKGYVIANSTFSWWAAYLSYSETLSIYAPKPWFKGEESPREIIPDRWNLIQAFGIKE